MLVLTRKRREQIRIGDDITITIVRIKNKTVRIGVEAPRHQAVLRGELVAADSFGNPNEEMPAAAEKAIPRQPAAGSAHKGALKPAPLRGLRANVNRSDSPLRPEPSEKEVGRAK